MKFKLTANVTISVYTEVEADTLEEAIELLQEDDSKYKDGDEIDWDLGWGISKTSLEDHLDDYYEVDE